MNNIDIRRAVMSDQDKLNTFFDLVLQDTFEKNQLIEIHGLLEEEKIDKRRCLEQDFLTGGRERYFLIAWLEDEVVGCIEYGSANELILTCTQNELREMLEIGTIFVKPCYQRRGVGKLLLRSILETLKFDGVKEVCFDSGYKTAQKIWKRTFGEPKYFLEDYWEKDAHHMVWVIEVEKELVRLRNQSNTD